MRAFWTMVVFSALTSTFATSTYAEPTDPSSGDPPPARGRAPVSLALSTCLDVRAEEVRRIVAIELRATLVDEATPTADTTAVVVDCHNPYAFIEVTDPITGKIVRRTIDLTESQRVARPRLLALSIAELVSASWSEIEYNPRPSAPVVGVVRNPDLQSAALDAVRARKPAASTYHLVPFAAVRFMTSGVASWGGGIQWQTDGPQVLGWRVDALVDHGTRATPIGRASFETLSGGAAVTAHLRADRWTFRGSVGVRGGVAWLAGTPARSDVVATSVRGLFGGPMVAAGASVALNQWVSLDAAAESGRVLLPVSGIVEGAPDVAIQGTWLGATVGIGLAL